MRISLSMPMLMNYSNGAESIVDAGCGRGFSALHLAKKIPGSCFHGYDVSKEAIADANRFRQEHGIENTHFSVASHDDYQPTCTGIGMIYTVGSLVGRDEVPAGSKHPFDDTKEIVKSRISRFRELLTTKGVYVMQWCACNTINEEFTRTAEQCGFRYLDSRQGRIFGATNAYRGRDELVIETAMAFEAN